MRRLSSGSIVVLVAAAAAFAASHASGASSSEPVPEPIRADVDPGDAPHTLSADETARQLANPNNSLASLTFRNQFRWFDGDLPGAGDEFNYTLLFQPVFPFTLPDTPSGGKANLFVRPAIPILIEQPVFDASGPRFKSATGLGDLGFDIGYGVTEKTGFLWALGMVGTLPTATDNDLSGGQLRLEPEALITKFAPWGGPTRTARTRNCRRSCGSFPAEGGTSVRPRS